MRRVAAELGAGTMTLYHYVRNKDELLALMGDAIMGELLIPDDELPDGWREGLAEIARRTRAIFAAPSVDRSSTSTRAPQARGPNALRHIEQSLPVAARTGPRRVDEQFELIALVDDYVFGFAIRTTRARFGEADAPAGLDVEARVPRGPARDTGEFPHLARADRRRPARGRRARQHVGRRRASASSAACRSSSTASRSTSSAAALLELALLRVERDGDGRLLPERLAADHEGADDDLAQRDRHPRGRDRDGGEKSLVASRSRIPCSMASVMEMSSLSCAPIVSDCAGKSPRLGIDSVWPLGLLLLLGRALVRCARRCSLVARLPAEACMRSTAAGIGATCSAVPADAGPTSSSRSRSEIRMASDRITRYLLSQEMARTSTLRASDADRETVTTRLHQAAVEGRLEPEELEERLHLALRARTYGELRRLVADLPAKAAPCRRRAAAASRRTRS